MNMASKLEIIPEYNVVNLYISSDHEIEELQDKMNFICNQISKEFYGLKYQITQVSDILEKNFNKSYLNNNFDDQEIIEEQIDKFIYKYQKIKKNLKDGREVRSYMENKQKQKSNELKYARNLLECLGINPENYN